MNRKSILELIDHYRKHQEELFRVKQDETLEFFKDFILLHPNCFERSNSLGHITGSAFIFSRDFKRLLLMHHKKLDKWIQMGGHADGHHLTHEVAAREALEESGLTDLVFAEFSSFIPSIGKDPFPLDFDIHVIPETGDVGSHLHLDVRYLLISPDETAPLINSDEAFALEWVSVDDIERYTNENSILRPISKVQNFNFSPCSLQEALYRNR